MQGKEWTFEQVRCICANTYLCPVVIISLDECQMHHLLSCNSRTSCYGITIMTILWNLIVCIIVQKNFVIHQDNEYVHSDSIPGSSWCTYTRQKQPRGTCQKWLYNIHLSICAKLFNGQKSEKMDSIWRQDRLKQLKVIWFQTVSYFYCSSGATYHMESFLMV